MERDDVIEYSLDSHHDEETGKKIRKRIVFVTILLTVVTVVEVALGAYGRSLGVDWELIKWVFIVLTIVKAAYIVMVFMHLGDERKALRLVILSPYAFFILYLLFIAIKESTYIKTWIW